MNEVLKGAKAPKDPTKKRPGFCIMKNKSICGSPQKDGSGIQFIYENDGRMLDAAKLVGNITDENIIEMLKKTDSFKKLVHSIGVSVETDDREDVLFAFQMYGHKDIYGSGTTLKMQVPGDGMEYILELDSVDWSDDDNEPGQIRFHMKKGGDLGKATVKFYVRDGFNVPKEEEENPVDFNSDAYKEMISKSLMLKGNTARINRAYKKAKEGKNVTLAFIGGSITQGAGAIPINKECYARKIFEGFCDSLNISYDSNVHYVKAGVGGTPSELGMLRYERDVLKNGKVTPDLVVIEFAVNDEGDETHGECFDSLARKIYNGPGNPAVILLYSVFSDDNNLQDRLSPVGYAYDIPMVSVKDAVVPEFYKKEGRVLSKNQYFYDRYHPNNTGHRIMADSVLNLINEAVKSPDTEEKSIKEITPPIGGEFENVILFDKKDHTDLGVVNPGSFTDTDTTLQSVEQDMNLTQTPMFPYNWYYKGKETGECGPFKLDVEATALLIIFKDSCENADGTASVFVDGKKILTLDPKIVGWTHCNPTIIFRNSELKKRHIEVKVDDPTKNFTILGFGICK
ncbi:MAG: SGNH/GDSL hydrolase family protein [Lachnospiraceae bacterium]|nr:SGNH/GDSL hydrolase family protein [Lachnospiraceae bacterium]